MNEQNTYKGDEQIWSKDERDEQTTKFTQFKTKRLTYLTDLTSLTSRINYFTFSTEIKDGVNSLTDSVLQLNQYWRNRIEMSWRD